MKRTTAAVKRDLVEVLNKMSLNDDTITGNQKKSLKKQLNDNAISILNSSVDFPSPLSITYFKSIFFIYFNFF